jgi:hypothetical protein
LPDDKTGKQLDGRDLWLALDGAGDGAGAVARRQRCGRDWRRDERRDRGGHQGHKGSPIAAAINRGAGAGLSVPAPRLDERTAISR